MERRLGGRKLPEFRELIVQLFRERRRQPHLTVTLLRQHWAEVLGAELARKTWPARLAGNLLWINTVDAGWAYQLQFMKRDMLESIQLFMGTPTITELRFRQGEVPPPAPEPDSEANKAPPSSRPRRGAAPAEAVPASAAPGSAAIADETLRDSFSRWHGMQQRRKRKRDGAPNPGSGPGSG